MKRACYYLWFWAWAAISLAACSSAKEADAERWMKQVEEAHQIADRAASDPAQQGAAEQALEDALKLAPVGSGAALHWVQQDLCVRLASLNLLQSEPAVTLRWVDTGLALGTDINIARAELLRLRGDALEALGNKEAAAAALHEALKVNEALLKRALGDNTSGQELP
jgi:hypothetical protein